MRNVSSMLFAKKHKIPKMRVLSSLFKIFSPAYATQEDDSGRESAFEDELLLAFRTTRFGTRLADANAMVEELRTQLTQQQLASDNRDRDQQLALQGLMQANHELQDQVAQQRNYIHESQVTATIERTNNANRVNRVQRLLASAQAAQNAQNVPYLHFKIITFVSLEQ